MKTLDMEFIQTEATLKNLIYLFARSIDRVDEELMRELFWPDATDDHGLFTGTAEDYVAWVIPLLKSMNGTQHTISNILVEVEGDKASAETYFVAYHQIGDGDEAIDMIAAGRYFDNLRSAAMNGNSLIAKLCMTGTVMILQQRIGVLLK